MPRYARVLSQSQVYHVMHRGNNKENIFKDEEDKQKIIEILIEKKKEQNFYVYAFCIMNNHLHLIVKEGTENIAKIMKRIACSYAFYFNKKYHRIGHVFQDRYKSENIETDSYLFAAIRYIHQNPLKANISGIEEYSWSSYKEYVKGNSLIIDDEILEMISKDRAEAIEEFIAFNHIQNNNEFIDIEQEKELNEENIHEYIDNYLNRKRINKNEIRNIENIKIIEEMLKEIIERSNISSRRISDILGLNREIVRKTIR